MNLNELYVQVGVLMSRFPGETKVAIPEKIAENDGFTDDFKIIPSETKSGETALILWPRPGMFVVMTPDGETKSIAELDKLFLE